MELFVNFITPSWVGANTQHTQTHTLAHMHTEKQPQRTLKIAYQKCGRVGGRGAALGLGVNVRRTHRHTHKYTQAHYINLHAFIAAQRERNKQTNNLHTHTQLIQRFAHTHTRVHISRCLLYATTEALCLHTCKTPLSTAAGSVESLNASSYLR